VPRSTYYYQPRPESAENLRLLRQLDRLYLKCPFYGSRKMAHELAVNRKRIQRLMRILGIEALYPKPNLSRLVAGRPKAYRSRQMGRIPEVEQPGARPAGSSRLVVHNPTKFWACETATRSNE
jgi:hypothetical protein